MAKMNPEVKARWVAALRSGEYRQAQGALRTPVDPLANDPPNAYCCLGVLCDLYAAELLTPSWQLSDVECAEASLPNQRVARWAGLECVASNDLLNNDPVVTIKGKPARVSKHNDDGCTFAEIADAIEAQL